MITTLWFIDELYIHFAVVSFEYGAHAQTHVLSSKIIVFICITYTHYYRNRRIVSEKWGDCLKRITILPFIYVEKICSLSVYNRLIIIIIEDRKLQYFAYASLPRLSPGIIFNSSTEISGPTEVDEMLFRRFKGVLAFVITCIKLAL